jgi:hypothetical protein
MLLVKVIVTSVGPPVRPVEYSFPMHFILSPGTYVFPAIRPDISAFAFNNILVEVTFI